MFIKKGEGRNVSLFEVEIQACINKGEIKRATAKLLLEGMTNFFLLETSNAKTREVIVCPVE
jgi:hypothetical protein